MVRNPPANAGAVRNLGSIPGSERSPGVGNSNPFQYSNLENSKWTKEHGGLYSPWSHKELDMTEHMHTHTHTHTHNTTVTKLIWYWHVKG